MNKKLKVKIATLISIFVLAGSGLMIWFKNHKQIEMISYGELKRPFLIETLNHKFYSDVSLKNNISVFVMCTDCSKSLSEFKFLSEPRNDLFVFCKKSLSSFCIEVAPNFDLKALLKTKDDVDIAVVDYNLILRWVSHQDVASEKIEPLISKLMFEKNLLSYLSKRTFFGPKRIQN